MMSSRPNNNETAAASTISSSTIKHPSPLFPRIVAGSLGSLITALAVTPLEVVKVRQQAAAPSTTTIDNTIQACRSCGTLVYNNGLMECVVPRDSVPPSPSPKIHGAANSATTTNQGTFAMMRSIFATEGLGGIYAGLRPTLVMSVPSTVLYFCAYDELSSKFRKHYTEHGTRIKQAWWIPLVSGSSARLLSSFATSPLELIRTQQALLSSSSQAGESQSLVSIMRSMIRSGGVMSLYRGLAPTLWRDVPFSAIYWYSIEQMKEMWKNRQTVPGGTAQLAFQAFVNGAFSGMIAAACTTPFDVLKTRQQQQQLLVPVTNLTCTHNGAIAVASPPSLSQLSLARSILHEEGIRGFWRGNLTRMMKVAPACAIMISCYEGGKLLLTSH